MYITKEKWTYQERLEDSLKIEYEGGLSLINVSRGILYSKDPALAAIDYKSKINLVLKNLVGT